MVEVLHRFDSPYVVKDPRFVVTLDKWTRAFQSLGDLPCLLYLVRERARLEISYLQRGEVIGGSAGEFGLTLEELVRMAQRQVDTWPGPKVQIALEDIERAVAIFGGPRRMSPQGGLWHTGTPPPASE